MADNVQQPKPQGGDYRPHYRKREADAYMDQLQAQLRDAKQKLAILFDSSCYSDSLGVEGSSFTVCRWCGGGSSPGKGDFKHNMGCLFDDDALERRVKDVWEEVPELEAEFHDLKSLHAAIIDQGRKVLNATSDIGMSHAEFIEWVMKRLEGK